MTPQEKVAWLLANMSALEQQVKTVNTALTSAWLATAQSVADTGQVPEGLVTGVMAGGVAPFLMDAILWIKERDPQAYAAMLESLLLLLSEDRAL